MDSAEEAYKSCLSRGAIGYNEPFSIKDKDGHYGKSSIKTYGFTIHSFINDSNYKGLWAPNFINLELPKIKTENTALEKIDHIVGNVELNKMDDWKKYYETIFGFMTFVRFDETDISTKYSSLKEK